MAPASANSMAAAKPITRTADMNRIEDDAPSMRNYESELAAVVKVPLERRSQTRCTSGATGTPTSRHLTRPPRLRHITHPTPSH